MKNSWSKWLWEQSPPWLKGKWGTRFIQVAFGMNADVFQGCVDDLGEAKLNWRYTTALPDAMQLVGEERGLPRYPNEEMSDYRERVASAWTIYAEAGSTAAIVHQLAAAGYPDAMVQKTIASPWPAVPANNVDAIKTTADYWSQFAVVIPFTPGKTPTPAWHISDGTFIGEPGKFIGPMSLLYPIEDMFVMKQIIKKFKPANYICSALVFLTEDATALYTAAGAEHYRNDSTGLWSHAGTEFWAVR
jgi:hypothetical protein